VLDYQIGADEGPAALVTLSGELTGEGWTKRLKTFLERKYLDDGITTIQIDLTRLERIDLEGIATLLALQAEALARDKRVVVRGASGQVLAKLRQTMAHQLLAAGEPPDDTN
jgi:ABC-type transporter Mla MlaB component